MADSAGFQTIITNLQQLTQAINAVTKTVTGALAQVWASFAEQEVADAATVTLDLSTGFNFGILATENTTLANPVNAKVGQKGYINWTQNGTGGYTLAFGTDFVASGGVASLEPTTTANAVNIFQYVVLPGPLVFLTISANVTH